MVDVEARAVIMISLFVPADGILKNGPGWIEGVCIRSTCRSSEILDLSGGHSAVIPLIWDDTGDIERAIRGLLVEGRDGFPSGILGLAKEGILDSLEVTLSGHALITFDLHRNDQKLDVAI